MDVLLQGFYWRCFEEPGVNDEWWPRIAQEIPELAALGFSAVWLPPAQKGAHIYGQWSMGYDPFDYYDLGEFDQRGRTKTNFGSRADLDRVIQLAHQNGMKVLADVVFNHCSGGEEDSPDSYKIFRPASGRFPRDPDCFHPSSWCDRDGAVFGGMPDLCHENPYVAANVLEYCRWLIEEVGYDGFRYDLVKGFGEWMIAAIQQQTYWRDGQPYRPYGVGEAWASENEIDSWLEHVNRHSVNPVSAFDFPLRYTLKDLCDTFGFDMRRLTNPDELHREKPFQAVTFVDNHDFRGPNDNGDPIINAKLLAYAYILTHEGLPCVFWKDYFNENLAQVGKRTGIAALVQARKQFAGGKTETRWASSDAYVAQRLGTADRPGLVVGFNNRGDGWRMQMVDTGWPDRRLQPVAWWSEKDASIPDEKVTDRNGRMILPIPPRGYVVYAPVAP